MKTIHIELTNDERAELMNLRNKSGDYRSERALAVLHCADGKRPCQIAEMLKRSSQCICQWLNAFKTDRISGLQKDFSPGRPSMRKMILIPRLNEYLSKSPRDFGWGEDVWTVKVIQAQFQQENGSKISRFTVIRALEDAGFTAKRAKKAIPLNAPSKEEKLAKVQEIAEEIRKLKLEQEVEVMFLDESHFSTEPYIVRGWSKKGQPFFPQDTVKKGGMHDIWGIRAGNEWFLLEKFCSE